MLYEDQDEEESSCSQEKMYSFLFFYLFWRA